MHSSIHYVLFTFTLPASFFLALIKVYLLLLPIGIVCSGILLYCMVAASPFLPGKNVCQCCRTVLSRVPDSLVPGNPYNLWISTGVNHKHMDTFESQNSTIGLASVYLAKTDVSGAKIHVSSLDVPN
jgi:hypothetical protein